MVRAHEVAPRVPAAPRRSGARGGPAAALRQPGLLTPGRLRALLDRLAAEEGFGVLGVTRPDAAREAGEKLHEAIADGHHGTMAWMAETAARRADPRALMPDVRSIVMLGMNYGPESDPLASLTQSDRATLSVYARNRDYHDVVKGALKRIATRFAAQARKLGAGADIKVFVDTAPVMEKPLAAAAGLGWQGKHTNLVSRRYGSWLFLGAVFTDADLAADAPERESCGSCRACLDACPTGAFPAPYRLDARRCISYLTIEHSGPLPRDMRPLMGNRIYGCDDCLAVCPWNKFAEAASEAKLRARADLDAPPLADLARLDDPSFRARFSGSPIKRIGRDRFVRNVLVAIGNSGEGTLVPEVLRLLGDASPLVRGAAVWALSRLDGDALRREAAERLPCEEDASVRGEWDAALAEAA